MAAGVAPPVSAMRHEDGIQDTRTPSPVQRTDSNDGVAAPPPAHQDGDSYKPDLSAEVAMLSTKLVNAINYQTNLDDSLQQTRHELEQARKELETVREQKREQDNLLASGQLVRRSYIDKEMASMREELAQERAARAEAEKAKKETEGELENLTTALFEEANGMVAAARKDTEAMERRNSQLRNQLNDTELLLASQTEQLQDLKGVMASMETRSEHGGGGDASVPVTPVDAHRTAVWDSLHFPSNGGSAQDVPPDHPLHFSQLLLPVMRTDITAYTDFQELLSLARRASPHSRQASGSTNNLASNSQTNLSSAASSSPSLPGAFSFGGSSANNSPSSSQFGSMPAPPLKDSKFYKRTLLEDIEPTLRLDLAPGLSFLSRRSVLSSLLSGSLVVEPFASQTRSYGLGAVFSCALCGEARKNEPYVRKYRFRTSESEDAQRYPLCDWCLGRIRAAGDFVGFLRMVRDGHWRCESDEEVKGAWEEATRLRERMFWTRLGGGVVPAMQAMKREIADSPQSVKGIKSGRPSVESVPERQAKENLEAAMSSVTEVPADDASGELQMPQPPQRSRSASQIARAVMGASSGVVATARPDATPQQPEPRAQFAATNDGQIDSDQVSEASESQMLEAPETPDQEATTPFEDAQTDSQEQQLQADEQLQRESAEAHAVARPDSEQSIPTVKEPAPSPPGEEKVAPPPNERRPSAVQLRIQAMEAKARESQSEKKLPGAFE